MEASMVQIYEEVHLLNLNSKYSHPDSNAHGAIMGPTWGRQDPGGPHDGPTNCYLGSFHQNIIQYMIVSQTAQYWQSYIICSVLNL